MLMLSNQIIYITKSQMQKNLYSKGLNFATVYTRLVGLVGTWQPAVWVYKNKKSWMLKAEVFFFDWLTDWLTDWLININ